MSSRRKSNLLSMDYSTQSQPDFPTFFRGWLTHLEFYLHQLLQLIQFPDQQDESKLEKLNRRVMTHYHDYFLAKAQVSRDNVFLVLSPPWFSSYERTFLWVAGFKPCLAISVVKSCGVELRPDQAERIERLRVETKDEEKEITDMFARLEQQIVAPPMLALARMGGREVNGMVHAADYMVNILADDMEVLVGCADYLREKTVAKVVAILSTTQTVRFLAGLAQLQLRVRRWGQLRDAEARGDHVNLS